MMLLHLSYTVICSHHCHILRDSLTVVCLQTLQEKLSEKQLCMGLPWWHSG